MGYWRLETNLWGSRHRPISACLVLPPRGRERRDLAAVNSSYLTHYLYLLLGVLSLAAATDWPSSASVATAPQTDRIFGCGCPGLRQGASSDMRSSPRRTRAPRRSMPPCQILKEIDEDKKQRQPGKSNRPRCKEKKKQIPRPCQGAIAWRQGLVQIRRYAS
jgi:hypothetical protein